MGKAHWNPLRGYFFAQSICAALANRKMQIMDRANQFLTIWLLMDLLWRLELCQTATRQLRQAQALRLSHDGKGVTNIPTTHGKKNKNKKTKINK
jgi:hypothetical protein